MSNEQSESQELPLLPDGIGMSVDNVRALLLQKHQENIPINDPLLMVVTILNAFLEEQQKLQEQHKKALAAFMTEHSQGYVAATQKSAEEITHSLSALTAKGLNEATKDMTSFRTTMQLCTGIVAISAIIIAGVFAWGTIHG